jgi:hypothetical protein
MARAIPTALLSLALGAVPALAETKPGKPSRAETEARLKSLFPAGHREGREGVMTLGGNFRTVAIRTWQQCRDLCLKTPSDAASGCALWTFVKADDAQLPNVCRMWPTLPEMRDNPAAVSGAGTMK